MTWLLYFWQNPPGMSNLRISLCQFNISWQDAATNRRHLEQLFKELDGPSDLIILPEMFSTGFSMDSSNLAEKMDGPTVEWMKNQSNLLDTAMVGSLIIQDGTSFYNRMMWIEPGTSKLRYYDKKHLFSLADENKYYKAGHQKLILEYKSWKMALFICYDLRFPVWSRNTERCDLMIYAANWPTKRSMAWNHLLPARAIENQCFVAGVNRVGLDGNAIPYSGDSTVYDFEGKQILNLGSKETIQTIELDHHDLEVYRRAYPFLKDADGFTFLER